MKKILLSASAVLALLLSGCGSDEDTSCRLNVQREMDSGNFDAVIEELNQTTCQEEFDGNEYRITLAAAYMNKSGLNFTSIITILSDSATTDFASFANSVESKSSGRDSRANLERAKQEYSSFLNNDSSNYIINCEDTSGLSYAKQDVCLFKSLTETLIATKNITSLTANISAWLDTNTTLEAEDDLNSDDIPDDVNGNSCALKYSIGKSCETKIDGTTQIKNVTKKTVQSDLTIGTHTYELIETTVKSTVEGADQTNTFASLIYPANKSTQERYKVLTEGFCRADGNIVDDNITKYVTDNIYPCPALDGSNNPINYNDNLVENLNAGLDGTSSVIQDDSVKESIADFKKDFTQDDAGKKLTIEDAINFLDTPKKKEGN